MPGDSPNGNLVHYTGTRVASEAADVGKPGLDSIVGTGIMSRGTECRVRMTRFAGEAGRARNDLRAWRAVTQRVGMAVMMRTLDGLSAIPRHGGPS